MLYTNELQFHILHVHSHTNLPGFNVKGNACADKLTALAWAALARDRLQQAIQFHQFFHQGAHALRHQFNLIYAAAHDIIASCSDCQQHVTMTQDGRNPRGLQALQLWQPDITHVSGFGCLKYVLLLTLILRPVGLLYIGMVLLQP